MRAGAYLITGVNTNPTFNLWHCGKFKEMYVATTNRDFPNDSDLLLLTKDEIETALNLCKDSDTIDILLRVKEDCGDSSKVVYLCQ